MRLLLFILLYSQFSFAQNSTDQLKKKTAFEEGITFKVDDVEATKSPLSESKFQDIAENKFQRPLFTFPDALKTMKLAPSQYNSFLYAIHSAYADHRPLILSPDAIWLTLCQGFGNHLVLHGEEWEDKLLMPNHPNKITIRDDDLNKDRPDLWANLIEGFSEEIESYSTPEALNLVQGNFSTTTPLISTVYQITLMDAMKSYFKYFSDTGCGIPSITLLGTTADWKKIYKDVDKFSAFGLEEWVAEIKPILKEFVEASEGNENTEFWQSIYKNVSFYFNDAISGWVLKFYPYLRTEERLGEVSSEENGVQSIKTYRPNPYLKGKEYLLSTINEWDIPKGYVEMGFDWNILLKNDTLKNEMLLYGGFIGIKQNSKTMAVQPHIAWAICKDSIPNDFEANPLNYSSIRDNNEFEHRATDWGVRYKGFGEISRPIYNPEKNETAEEGRKEFVEALKSSGLFSNTEVLITIMISWKGDAFVSEVEGYSKESTEVIYKYVQDKLNNWSPAKSELENLNTGELAMRPFNFRMVFRFFNE
ncbi:MAG: hypothetical protein ACJASQ_003868 [Crocinitomicaceae bacterium]|jgi:hypothetical protein